MGIRPLHLNFFPEPLLICHPSELHTICSVCLQTVPREYYSASMPQAFHLFALFLITMPSGGTHFHHREQAALMFTRKGKVHQGWTFTCSFRDWGIFNLEHTCDSQEKCCPCFWMELHMDSREGSKWTWRHRGCVVSFKCLSTHES